MADDLPLFRWALARPTAEVVSLDEFRRDSPRWALEIRPRETVQSALRALDRCLGLEPTPPLARFPETRPLRRA